MLRRVLYRLLLVPVLSSAANAADRIVITCQTYEPTLERPVQVVIEGEHLSHNGRVHQVMVRNGSEVIAANGGNIFLSVVGVNLATGAHSWTMHRVEHYSAETGRCYLD